MCESLRAAASRRARSRSPNVERARPPSSISKETSASGCASDRPIRDPRRHGLRSAQRSCAHPRPGSRTRRSQTTDGGNWCATQAMFDFCTDFDVSLNAESGWMPVYKYGGGVIERSATFFTSSPASVHLTTPGATVTSLQISPQAVLERRIQTSARRAQLEFDMRASEVVLGSNIEEMRFARLAQTGEVILAVHQGGWYLIVNPPVGAPGYSEIQLTNMPALDTFKHVFLEVVWGRGTGTVRLDVGRELILSRDSLVTGDASGATNNVFANVGIKTFEGTYPAAEEFADNVIVPTFPQ